MQIKEEVARLKAENAQLKDDKETLLSAVSRHAAELATERKANKLLKDVKDAANAEMERLKADLAKASTELKVAQKRWWHWLLPA